MKLDDQCEWDGKILAVDRQGGGGGVWKWENIRGRHIVSSLTSIISDVPGNVNSQDDFKVWGDFTRIWRTPEKSFLKDRKWFEVK